MGGEEFITWIPGFCAEYHHLVLPRADKQKVNTRALHVINLIA